MRYGLTLATAFLILLGHAAIAQVSTSANLTISVVPGITLSPTSLTFGSQLVGTTSVAQTTTFHNAATVAVVPTISITGTNSAEFSQSASCASPLPSGGNCTVSVTFTPSGAGTRMAALTISAPGGYTYTAGLSGTGTAVAPSITFTPNTLTFASQVVGTSSASKSLVARNGGNVTETISGISLTGSNPGDYSQTNNCPGSLAINATCTINVTFTPGTAGTRTATVSVAANGGPYTAALSGTAAAAAPLVTFAPSSLTFASQTLNTSSPSQAVVATNAGNVAVVISGVTLTGSNPGDYSLAPAGTCSGTLAVAATCTVNVTFTPTVTGTRTASVSVAGNGGPYTAALTGTGGGTFPLVVSSGVLKTQGGAPFLMVGDTPQSIMGKLPVCTAGNTFALCQNSADALPTQTMVAFFRDRAAHGFNTEQINIFCDTGISCGTDAPTLADGVTHPFTGTLSGCVTGDQTCYDLATPNTAYFTAVDAMIQMAGKFNQNVLLTLGNPKCNGDGTRGAGFIGTLFKNNAVSSAKVTGFGTFIGTRYNAASFPNIVYQFGNDYLCYQTAADDNPAFAFMTAVKTADTNHLQTMQASFNLSTSLDNTTNNWAGLLSLNGAYTYYPPYDDITHARAQNLTKPAFVIESNYEGEDNLGCNTPSTSRDRKTLWWTFMSGGQGYIYGSQYSWPFAPGWNTASNIDTADVTQISYLYNFLNPLAWSTLVPDIGHTLVTAGFGTYANAPFTYGVPGGVCAVAGQNVADNTYVTSAKSSNGALALAYLPSNATITANMATLGTSATAVWYDPTKDPALGSSYTAICSPTGTNCASGSTTFKPSNQGLAAHTDGANDWVLKITATPVSGSSITGIALSNNSFTAPASDGTVVGSITVPGNNNSAATLSIIGTDAARFRLSSTTVPSNLLVNGTQSCNSSNCSVSLVATLAGATGSPFTQAETITGVGGGSATAYLSAASTILPVANGATSANTTTPHGSSAILTWDSSNAASCNATSGNFSTSGTSSGTLTVSPTANTTYSISCGGATASATVTVTGNLINAATTYCAANGGGNGSSGSPWKAACIQQAMNAAQNGDTIFLAAGNWALFVEDNLAPTTSTSVNLVGAGSGNTFDAQGHPNPPANGADICPTSSSSVTCVMAKTTTGSGCAITNVIGTNPDGGDCFGGWIAFNNTSNQTIANLVVDGSLATAGGDSAATLVIKGCTGLNINNIRVYAYNLHDVNVPETQFFTSFCSNVIAQNSVFLEPSSYLPGGLYPNAQVWEPVSDSNELVQNNVFYQFTLNPTYVDSMTYTGNSEYAYNDGTAGPGLSPPTGPAVSGCALNPNDIPTNGCPTNNLNTGTFHQTTSNNYFYAPGNGNLFSIGGGVNDPATSGNISDLHYTGNWIISDTSAIDSCVWRTAGGCLGTAGTNTVTGMSINESTNGSCVASVNGNGNPFAITNNSISGTASAQLNAQGTGSIACLLAGADANTPKQPCNSPCVALPTKTYNFTATKNYLNSPSNQYNSNGNTVSPAVTGNYCAQANGFTQTDSSQCASSGFVTLPTVTFTLGRLSAGVVQFVNPTFTAQYGAVKWIASTTSTTPGSGDSRWSPTPPVSVAAAHGSTVYMWTMDSVNNISTVHSVVVP